MKPLQKYIDENISSVSLKEGLRIGINDNPYTISPTGFKELRQIIEERFEKLGPGTEQEPIDFNDIDVTGMTTFFEGRGLFENTKFEYIDISNWDVSNIEDMRYLFFICKQLKSVGDLSNWNVSNVTNMKNMFSKCFKLESIGDLSNWNISKVENIQYMFNDCINLKFVGDLSNWNTSSIKNIVYMFKGSGITNIPKWYKG